MATPSLQVEGFDRFRRQVIRRLDVDTRREIGQVNKDIGRLVIRRLRPSPSPPAVGEGRGKTVRPSATVRDVILRVGGSHRAGRTPQHPWGTRRVGHPRSAPARPHIIGTARDQEDEIGRKLLAGYERALKPPFR